jgi:hypothetical protein
LTEDGFDYYYDDDDIDKDDEDDEDAWEPDYKQSTYE